MASRTQIWEGAKSAVRDEVRRRREGQIVWTVRKPSEFGLDADNWLKWSRAMVRNFNDMHLKAPVAISDDDQRDYVDKTFLEFAGALRDA